MKKALIYIERYSYLVPVIMLSATLISNFITLNYVVAGNILGYSILSNLFILLWFNRRGSNYCYFSRNSGAALILINIIDIAGQYLPYQIYAQFFNIAVCSVSLIFFIVYKFFKK